MNKLFNHLRTINKHKLYVSKACFSMGLYWQGITHDLSKYSIKELSIAKYYSGKRSPHAEARDILGYSPSWNRHYHKNKHHFQFWIDFEDWPDKIIPIKMPYKYVVEMFCDFIGAGKAYNPGKWDVTMPLQYWKTSCEGKRLMHKESEELFVKLLKVLYYMPSETTFYEWYNQHKKELKAYYEAEDIKGGAVD